MVNSPSANTVLGNIVDSPQPWLSSKQSPNLIGSIPYSPGDSSPKTPAFGASDVHNAAVMEAKKWLEEKKLTSKSKVDLALGPCTLNTDILHCVSFILNYYLLESILLLQFSLTHSSL